jgi:hypothetical protein
VEVTLKSTWVLLEIEDEVPLNMPSPNSRQPSN